MWKGFFKNSKSTFEKYKLKKINILFSSSGVLDYPYKNSNGLGNRFTHSVTKFKAMSGCLYDLSILKVERPQYKNYGLSFLFL